MNHCGTCTACCRVYAIPVLAKPAGRWCQHCAVGKGCRVYDQRPQLCADFECVWLQQRKHGDSNAADELRPDRCKVVFAMTTNPGVMGATVMPGAPTAWRRKPVRAAIDKMVRDGLTVVVGLPHATDRTVIDARGERPVRLTEPDENGMQWGSLTGANCP